LEASMDVPYPIHLLPRINPTSLIAFYSYIGIPTLNNLPSNVSRHIT
jgi:hypothetical protein